MLTALLALVAATTLLSLAAFLYGAGTRQRLLALEFVAYTSEEDEEPEFLEPVIMDDGKVTFAFARPGDHANDAVAIPRG